MSSNIEENSPDTTEDRLEIAGQGHEDVEIAGEGRDDVEVAIATPGVEETDGRLEDDDDDDVMTTEVTMTTEDVNDRADDVTRRYVTTKLSYFI